MDAVDSPVECADDSVVCDGEDDLEMESCFDSLSNEDVFTSNVDGVDPENMYLPQSVWDSDCAGQRDCTLSLTNTAETHSCESHNDGPTINNTYYDMENTVPFDDFEGFLEQMLPNCQPVDLKVLGICEAAI